MKATRVRKFAPIALLLSQRCRRFQHNECCKTHRASFPALVLLLALPIACASPSALGIDAHASADGVIKVPPPPTAPTVTESRATYYRQAFPKAAKFTAKPIPDQMIPSFDRGNETYVVAFDDDGEIIGYLRDFTGPVSLFGDCACNPLSLTLVFKPDFSLQTIITPGPLEKRDHTFMTPAEQRRLIQLAKTPPRALLDIRRAEKMVDATSGATTQEYSSTVIPGAALSTHRIVHLVRYTGRILQGAPTAWDQSRAQAILDAPVSDASRARALAEFLPTAESMEMRQHLFGRMVIDYAKALRAGAEADDSVEARMLNPGLDKKEEADAVAAGCYELATAEIRLPFVQQCLTKVAATKQHHASDVSLARLGGTLLFLLGDRAEAATDLVEAAKDDRGLHDPQLHKRTVQALTEAGRLEEACARAQALYRAHPALPGAKQGLRACSANGTKITPILNALHSEQREKLIARRRDGDRVAETMHLEGQDFKTAEVTAGEPGKVSVLVFFSTWCPHCQRELPLINAFSRTAKLLPSLRGRVRIVGIRTAVERETEPYEEFFARYKPAFPVWTDPTMALAFNRFAKGEGVRPGLPTIAVTDPRGAVRYLFNFGPYSDVARQLQWATEDLLEREEAQLR